MAMQVGTPRNSWKWGLCFGLLLLALYWLYGWRPFRPSWIPVDDGLYIRNAEGILNWNLWQGSSWLGQFDGFSLAKAPLFSVWLALLHLLGIPLRVGEFVLLVGGPFLFKSAVRPATTLARWEFAVVTVLLVANPMLPEEFRLLRETLHVALTNLCLIAAVGLALRAEESPRERMRWASLTGLLLGLCYLNREEATWISMAVCVAIALVLARAAFQWRHARQSPVPTLKAHGLALLVLGAGFLLPVLTVCALNQAYYGSFITTFRRSPAFTGLYQRLTSLEPRGHQAYVPVARATRLKAYQLSPTFSRLKPFLEEPGSYWAAGNNEHAVFNGRSSADKEFFVSYFEFCLLYAAQQAGAKTAGQMEAMFRNIDAELEEAVQAGRIEAGSHGPAILAAPRPGDFKRILSASTVSLSSLIRAGRATTNWPPATSADHARLDDLARLTHSAVVAYPQDSMHHAAREFVFRWIKRIQQVLFPAAFIALFALLTWRRKEVFTLAPSGRAFVVWSTAIPLGGLVAFCLSMAVVDVLGFKFLGLGRGYNELGFAPLSVFCACVFVGVMLFVSRSGTPLSRSEETPAPQEAPG